MGARERPVPSMDAGLGRSGSVPAPSRRRSRPWSPVRPSAARASSIYPVRRADKCPRAGERSRPAAAARRQHRGRRMAERAEAGGVPIERLSRFIERAFTAVGMPEGDARIVAALMAEADALGSEGHGVFRLPQYVRRIRAGGLNLRPNIRIERERAGMALLQAWQAPCCASDRDRNTPRIISCDRFQPGAAVAGRSGMVLDGGIKDRPGWLRPHLRSTPGRRRARRECEASRS
jgi:Malate/L-lactate dehydrogenase